MSNSRNEFEEEQNREAGWEECDMIWLWCSARDPRPSFTACRLQVTFSGEQAACVRDP